MKEPLWTIQNAAAAIASGSHVLENDGSNIHNLQTLIHFAFPKTTWFPQGDAKYYGIHHINPDEWAVVTDNLPPAIKLSEIQFTKTITIKSGTYDHIKIVNGDVIIEGFVGVIE